MKYGFFPPLWWSAQARREESTDRTDLWLELLGEYKTVEVAELATKKAGRPPALSPEQEVLAMELYSSGWSSPDVAERVGCTVDAVKGLAKRTGTKGGSKKRKALQKAVKP